MSSEAQRPLETGWLPDTPTGDTLLRRFLHNHADVNAIIAEANQGRAEQRDGVFLADADSPLPFFNQAILTAPILRPDDPTLDAVESFFADLRRPVTLLSIWPTPDLTGRGWSLMGHPAFVVRGPGPASHERPAGVDIRPVRTDDDYRAAEQIMVESFGFEDARDEPSGRVVPPGAHDRGLEVWVGRYNGDRVAIGEVYRGHGVTNLCGGATLPAARRRGVWQALVWERVAASPDLPAVAFTSDMSRPGFTRMGFMPLTRFTMWWRG